MRPTIEILIRVAARGRLASLPIRNENSHPATRATCAGGCGSLDVLPALQTRSVAFDSLESVDEAGTVGLVRWTRGIVGGKSASPKIWPATPCFYVEDKHSISNACLPRSLHVKGLVSNSAMRVHTRFRPPIVTCSMHVGSWVVVSVTGSPLVSKSTSSHGQRRSVHN